MNAERYPSDLVADQYRLIDRIGSGGFAEVWAAEHKVTKKKCALKLLRAGHLANPLMRNRFEREGEILMKLDHPHIAKAIDFAIDGGLAYIAMELVEGITLGRELRARARAEDYFTADALLTILRPIAEALDYAHVHGVLHRDLKPGNVILTRDGVIRLLDFGIAKMLTAPHDMETTVGRLIGSKHYISPEQIRAKPIDARSDVFALGTVTFLMVTHRMAWARDVDDQPIRYDAFRRTDVDDIVSVINRILDDPRPRASQWRDGLSTELDDVLARAMAIEPDDRPASATAFVVEVERAIQDSDAFTQIIDADADIETVLRTQWVEDFMVIDDQEESIEVLDVTPGVVRVAGANSLQRPARSQPRWALLLVLVGLGVVFALAVVATVGMQRGQVIVPAKPAVTAKTAPAARARPKAPPVEPRGVKPPVTPSPTKTFRKKQAPSPAAAQPRPPPPPVVKKRTPLRRMLDRLSKDPSAANIAAARDEIVAGAKQLDDKSTRTAIERCAVGAAVVQNAEDLVRCGRRLERARGE